MMADGSKFADRLLNLLNITTRADLLLLDEICWARRLLIKDANLDGAEARLVIAKGQGIITVSTAIHDHRRRRFSISHELGHFEMHRGVGGVIGCTTDDIRQEGETQTVQTLEREANEFASAFLLPERFIAPLCKSRMPSLDHVAEIAESFSTSLIATALRYIKFCDEPVAIVFSKSQHIQWFQESVEFNEIRDDLGFFFDVHARIDVECLAHKLFQDPAFPSRSKKVPASAWFINGKFKNDATIQEFSIPMPNYNSVLTLIWIDDVIDDDEIEYDD